MLLCWLLLAFLTSAAQAALPPAVLLAEAGSDGIDVSYTNLYTTAKEGVVSAKRPLLITFDDNAYVPVLVHFITQYVLSKHERSIIEQRPALLLMPGDTVWVQHQHSRNTFAFKGRHQAELNFCRRMWLGSLKLAGPYTEMGTSATGHLAAGMQDSTVTNLGTGLVMKRHQPLDSYLRDWSRMRQEGDARIAELRRTAGIRPEVAASLARHIRLRLFELLLAPMRVWNRRDSLRVATPAYRDTVAAQARQFAAWQALPASAAQGVGWALEAYVQYQCVQARHFPTIGTRYTQAKQSLTGFHRAWVCYQILNEGRIRHQDIRRWLLDYAKWVAPYEEFVRVLRGEPTVPLRSYPTTAFSDSLSNAVGQRRHLTDVLAAYRGKVVLLDVWASWCVPCREEMPHSAALARRYASRGLVVLYLSTDQSAADWRQALRHVPAGAHYRFVRPAASAFLQEFDVQFIPRYLLIDRDGIVRNPDFLRPSDARAGSVLEKAL